MPVSPSSGHLRVQLPATPKSSGDQMDVSMSDDAAASDNGAESENASDMEVASEHKPFILAPTPFQLGKAPLQRRLASTCSQDSPKDLSSSSNSSQLPTPTAEDVAQQQAPQPQQQVLQQSASGHQNAKKKQFTKKAKSDSMDK